MASLSRASEEGGTCSQERTASHLKQKGTSGQESRDGEVEERSDPELAMLRGTPNMKLGGGCRALGWRPVRQHPGSVC